MTIGFLRKLGNVDRWWAFRWKIVTEVGIVWWPLAKKGNNRIMDILLAVSQNGELEESCKVGDVP